MQEQDSPPPWPRERSATLAEYEMFSVREDRVLSPEGGEPRDYHLVDSPGGVTVIARTRGGEIVLVEQFRHGTRELSLELPSGVVEQGEDPVAAGLRELREETGYAAEGAESIGRIDLNPSWQSTRVEVVVAREARREGEKELDAGEDTRVRTVSLRRLQEMVRRGEVRSAVALAALALLPDWGAEGS